MPGALGKQPNPKPVAMSSARRGRRCGVVEEDGGGATESAVRLIVFFGSFQLVFVNHWLRDDVALAGPVPQIQQPAAL